MSIPFVASWKLFGASWVRGGRIRSTHCSDVDLFDDRQRLVDSMHSMPRHRGALDLRVAEQQLHRPKVAYIRRPTDPELPLGAANLTIAST